MPYSKEFFALQLSYAHKLAKRFRRNLDDILFNYTTFSRSIDITAERPFDQSNPVWKTYIKGLGKAVDDAEWTHVYYLNHCANDPVSKNEAFNGNILFGSFYFVLRDDRVIRPHFIKLGDDTSPHSVISKERMAESIENLRRMFQHIKDNVSVAKTVKGNTWLYNLEAYRRLFPPDYTAQMEVNESHVFQFLSLWGQFFDRNWQVKDLLANELLNRIEALDCLANLRFCFPYQALMPQYDIQAFYDFYGIV